MPEATIDLLTKLNVAYKKLRLYPAEHTMCAKAMDAAMEALRVATSGDAVTIGFTGMTAVHKGAPLVDLGSRALALLDALSAGRVRWIRIDQTASRAEVVDFLLLVGQLSDSSAERPKDDQWQGIHIGLAEVSGDTNPNLYAQDGDMLRSVILSFRSDGTTLPMAEIGRFMIKMADEVSGGGPPLGVLDLAMGLREYIVKRSVFTAALSMGLSCRLGLPRPLIQQVGMAGLLADIALFRVDEDALARRHGGSQQIARWSEHPSDAARILAAAGAPSLVVVVAAEHHWGLKYASPARHPASSLVGLADTLIGHLLGGYGAPSRRLDLALIGLASEGTHYPVDLVRTVLDMSGLFVKGTRVRLSNRQKGEIVTANPNDPVKPEVLVDGEAEGMKLVDLASPSERLGLAAVLEE